MRKLILCLLPFLFSFYSLAQPTVISAITVDSDDNGIVDGLEIQFSEPIDDSDFTANAIADWTLDDGGGAVSFDGFNTTVGADTDADDEFVTLTISAGVSGTGVMNYAYLNDGGGSDDISNAGETGILANIGATAATDGAVPIVLQAITIDDGDGIVDGMELEFSEPIDDSDFTANAIADWTLDDGGGAAVFDGFSSTTNVVSGGADTDADDEFVTLTISTGVSGTDAMNYAYTNDGGDDITDLGTEVLADIGTTGATDGATVVVLQAVTLDDGDGVVDAMELEFSEPVTDTDFTANAIADWTLDDGGGAAVFDGFSSTTNVVSGGADTDADDEFVTLTISAGVNGTGSMDYAYTNDGGDDINDLDNSEVLANIGATAATDGAVPIVLQAITIDDGDGIVDGMELEFSEPIDDSDFTANAIADWTLDDGGGAAVFDGFSSTTNVVSGGADTDADDEFVTLTISTGVSGTDAMNYAYTNDGGDDITDLGTEVLADIGTTGATDGATVVVLQAVTLDDGDGVVDAMELEFSEPVTDTDFTANAIADWTLDDGGGAAVFDGFSSTTNVVSGGADTDADDEFVTLTISAGVNGTGSMDYAYTNDGGDDINDLDNSEVLANIGATAATDGAVPIVLQAITIDDGDGIVDGMELEFSEPIDDSDFTANAIADWTLDDGGGAAVFDGFSSTTNVVSGGADTDADDEFVTLTISTGVSGTDAMNYAYTNDGGDDITDLGTEVLADIGTTGATDGATVVVLQAVTLDDGDGVVDAMELEFSEPVTDTDFTANAIADWTLDDGGGAAVFDGFSSTTNVVSGGADTDADDEFVTLTISAGVNGTGSMDYAYTNDGGDDINDLDNSEVLANIGATAATDGAVPIVLQAITIDDGDGIVDGMELEFSEPIDDSDFTANAIADWTLDDGGGAAVFDGFSSTTNVVSGGADTDADDEFVTLTISTGVSGTDAMNYAYTNDGGDDITDLGTEVLADIGTTGATDGATVVVLQAVTLDDGDGVVDAMELEFSEPVTDTDFTANAIADWTLDDGGGAAVFDGFSSTTNVVSGGADTDADDEFVTLTISAGVNGTGSMDYAYTNDGGDDINDLDNSEVLANIGATAATDGAVPIVLQAITIDDGDGIVDGMELEFSEPIDDSDFTANAIADWTLDDGGGAAVFDGFSSTTNVVSGGADTDADDEFVTLTISTGVSGTDAMNYAYTNDGGDDITDLGTEVLADIGTTGATDGATVVVLQAVTLDDGDGVVDAMELEFSEPVTDTDFTANAIADWTLDDGGGAAVFDGFSSTTNVVSGGADTDADDEFVTLTISAGVNGTGSMDYAYTNDGGDDINDLDNSEVLANIGATAATDGALPVFVDASFYDVTIQDGIVDEILLEFSENIDETSVDDADFDIGGAGLGAVSFTVTAGASANNGVDTNDTDEFVTLAVSLNTTDDRSIVYTQNDDANDVVDGAGNQALNDAGLTTIDLAAPVLTELRIEDTDNDGIIDQMTYVFSEIVYDVAGGVTDEDIGVLRMPDNSFFDGNGGEALGDANVSLTNDGTYGLLVMDVAAAGYSVVGTDAGSANAEGTPASNFEDDQALTGVQITEAIVDLAKPRIMSVTITGNSTADIVFSEGVWGNVGNTIPVDEPNFSFNFQSGSLTGPTVVEVNSTGTGEPGLGSDNLVGGETDIRVFFSYTGSALGGETTQWNTDGNIYDEAGNTADATQYPTDNEQDLSPPEIPDMSIAEWLDQDGDGQIDGVGISFNTDWDIDEYNGSDAADGLDCILITNGGTPITQDNIDYDSSPYPTNGFFNAGDTVIIQFRGDQQPGTSIANLQVTYQTSSSDRIESQSTEDDAVPGDTPDQHFDLAAPRFSNFTVTILDNDADGNVDRIQVDAQDNIDDSSIDPSEFTYNGVVATGVVNIDNTDQSFTLTVNGSGTAVEGDFEYTPGISLLDTAANASNGGTIIAAAVVDGAGPVISNALTADTDNNGFIDEILVTFSENLANVFGSSASFSVDEGADNYNIVSATPGPANQVTLVLTEGAYTGNIPAWPAAVQGMDTYITPDVTISAGYGDDAAGALSPGHTFTNTGDGAAPYIRVTSQSSNNLFPDFYGEVDDPNASLIISVDGKTRSSNPPIANNGDGTWAYTSANDGTPIELQSGLGFYEVTVIGIDQSANNRTDATSNEYDLTGGATITAATLTGLCVSDGFQPLGSLRITETGTGDFGSSGTILLTLPSGFEFNTAITPTTAGSLSDITALTFTYIGSASLRLNITNDGSNDGIDDVVINALQVKAVLEGESGNLERTGGTASLLTSDTNYATLSSGTSPAPLTFVTDQDANNITEYTTNYFAYVDVVYSAPTSPPFLVGEEVSFAGGATGIVVSDNGIANMQIYLTDGLISEMTGVITGGTSGNTANTSSAIFNREDFAPFSLTVNPGGNTTVWNDAVSGFINNNVTNTNTDLSVTSVGLSSFDITLNDGSVGACNSEELRVNTFVYNDLSPTYQRTFQDNIYIESDDRDTIYLSQPANHTVSVTGAGVTVTNPSGTDLLILFDPAIAGVGDHDITYQTTNDLTNESKTIVVTMTVNPITEFFDEEPEHLCYGDLPLSLTQDETQYGPSITTDLQFERFFFLEYMSDGGNSGSFIKTKNDLGAGGLYPWDIPFDFESAAFSQPLSADEPGEGSAVLVERFTRDPNTGTNIFDYDYIFVYGTPLVALSNIEENYCDFDDEFTITRNLRYVSSFTADNPNNDITRWSRNYTTEIDQEITNGYTLEKWNGASYDPVVVTGAPINTFNPSDPDNDGNIAEDESGQYRITYTTENLTPANCTGVTSVVFNIRPKEATPNLTPATRTAGSSIGFYNNPSPDTGVDADEYVLEYCVGDILSSITAVNNNIYNYAQIKTGTITFPLGPAFTLNETVVGQTTGAKGVIVSIGLGTMEVSGIVGSDYAVGEVINGLTSGASSTVTSFAEHILTTETITGLTNGGQAMITELGPSRFAYTPISGSIEVNEIFVGSTSNDRGRITALGEISWYDDAFNKINGFENNYSIGTGTGGIGLNINASFRLLAEETETIYFSTTSVYGCETDYRKVTINVFDIPQEPVLDASAFPAAAQNGSIYTFDYCVEDGGGSIAPDPLILDDLLDDDRYNVSREFKDFSAATSNIVNSSITEIDGNTDTDDENIPVPAIFAGDTIIYLITKTENISIAPESAYSNFPGCTGANSIIVRIVAQEEATSPNQLDFIAGTTEFHICEGDALGNISHTFINGTDEYTWYEAVDGGNNGVTRIGDVLGVGDPMTEATLGTAVGTPFDANTPGVYTYYVSRNNDVIDSRDFDGCESEATAVSITVHAIQDAPSIVSDNSANPSVPSDFPNLDPDDDDFYEFAVCSDQLFSDLTFIAQDLYAGDERVEWYNASSGNLIFTGEQPNFSDLFLVGLGAQVVTFEVIQVTDTLTDSFGKYFDGCNSDIATVEITIADPQALVVVDASNIEINNEYCLDADPLGDMSGNINLTLRIGGSFPTDTTGVDFQIDSYSESNYLAMGAPDSIFLLEEDSLPTLNLVNLHNAVSGSIAVGGESTVHEITMYYEDPASFCTSSVTKVITINPDPDLTFTIQGTSNADPDGMAFCYDDDPVSIEGILNERTLSYNSLVGTFTNGEIVTGGSSGATGTIIKDFGGSMLITDVVGAFDAGINEQITGQTSAATANLTSTSGASLSLTNGIFSKTGVGLGGTNANVAIFNPATAHGSDEYATRSTHVINFTYTDNDGCQSVVSKTFYVDPRPETIPLVGTPQAGDEIYFSSICDDGGSTDVSVRMIDPADGVTEVTDFTGYTFTWTVGTTTFTPIAGDNTFSFTTAFDDIEIDVIVEDPNGCTIEISESHTKQSLPDLDMTLEDSGGDPIDFELCADDENPILDLLDFNSDLASPGASVVPGNVDSWSIVSSNSSGSVSSLANGSGVGSLPSSTDLDLQTLHENAGGNAYVDFGGGILRSVGGDTTYHDITIVYTDPELEYQGVNTSCSNSITKRLTIYPNPNVNFTVDGAYDDNIEFCYQTGNLGNITLRGVEIFANDTLPLSRGRFLVDGVEIPTNDGSATVNASELLGDPSNLRTEFEIEYRYTDANGTGCSHFFQKSIFVNPLPEFDEVVGGNESGDKIMFTSICNDGSAIDVEVQLIDPTDGAGAALVSDYTGYIFEWTIGSLNQTINDDNTFSFNSDANEFTIEVVVTDPIGCFSSVTETHQKQALPDLDFQNIVDLHAFCSDEPAIDVPDLGLVDYIGNVNGTAVDALDVVSWEVLSYATTNIDTVGFNPIRAGWANATVAQDADGGSIPVIDLQAWHEGAGGNAYVGGKSIGGSSTIHSIYITYQDPNRTYQNSATQCEITYAETIIINPSTDISFTLEGIDQDNIELCYDDTGIQLIGIDNVTKAPLGGGVFTIPGIALSTNNGEAVFTAADAHGDDPYAPRSSHSVEYTYPDDNGCEQTVTKTFFVNPRPEFVGTIINDDIDGIQVANSCASKDIKVYVEMTDDSHLYTFEWSVNGNVEQTLSGAAGGDTLIYKLGQGETTANFSVMATYDPTAAGATYTTSCVASSLSKSVTVGQEPIPAITWVGLTAGHPSGTDFTIYEDNAELADADVDFVELVIESTVVNSWSGDASNPLVFPLSYKHDFTDSGEFGVELNMTTTAGCDTTISRTISILPHYNGFGSSNTYEQNFENGSSFDLTATNGIGGWHIETRSLDGKSDDLMTTWIRAGSAPGAGNNTTAVYTEYNTIANPEQNREISFVYSPSFDISGFQSPTISVIRYSGFISFRDGAVLQYTEDDGRTWLNVGSYDADLEVEGLASTPGWYDREAITAAPGTQAPAGELGQNNQGIGWATEKGDDGSDWQLAISPLGVTDPDYIRFRFAIAGQAGDKEDAEGFGFDDFRIYDRDQIVLLELFSSTLTNSSVDFNNTINNDPDFNGTDILTINYFTDFANGSAGIDQMNRRNARDPGAKGSFYGISDVPSIAISGDAFLVSDPAEDLSELKARLDNAKLADPAFEIEIVTANVDVNNNLHVMADFTATTKFNPGTKIGLFAAVVEPEIKLDKDYGIYSEGDSLFNVLRKMLPSAAGQFYQLTDTLRVDQQLQLDSTQWSINKMFNPESFRVIVYAQNLKTREIYQAEFATVTGGTEILSSEDELTDISVYPNPADKEVTLEFANPISDLTEWVIYDQSGREVLKGEIIKGIRTMTVQTSDLPSGLYFIHLYGEDRKRQSKRVIVLH